MLVRNKGNPADAEAIDVLLAISEVSARMARKLLAIYQTTKQEKGEITNEHNERYLGIAR